MPVVYNYKQTKIYEGDAFRYLNRLARNSIDLMIIDPPYFLSNGGFSNSGGKMVSVDKGDWDKNEDPEEFYGKMLDFVDRLLTENGSAFVFGSMHNIYMLGYLINKRDFKILNNITWQKSNPAPNLSRRMFTHSTETVLWIRRKNGKQLFNYDLMRELNGGKQMKDVWITSTTNNSEKRFGKHPSQKPLALVRRMILAASNEGDTVLDPFMGSGTTVVAAKQLNRVAIGVDIEHEYVDIAINRVKDISNERIGKIK